MRAMRGRGYRGGFDHPLRAFLVGMGLLAVIVVGFVVGVDVGGVDSSQDATVTRHVRSVRTVVLAAETRTGAHSAPRYVVIDHVRWRVVRVREAPPARPGGGTRLRLVAVPPAQSPDRTVVVTVTTPPAGSTHEDAASAPATLLRTVTVDTPAVITAASTVTETVTSTVTETVTAPTTDTTETTTEPAPPPPPPSSSTAP